MEKYIMDGTIEEIATDSKVLLDSEENLKRFVASLDIMVEMIKRVENSYVLKYVYNTGNLNSIVNAPADIAKLEKVAHRVERSSYHTDYFVRLSGQEVSINE